jgi:hypothetical protein
MDYIGLSSAPWNFYPILAPNPIVIGIDSCPVG